MIIRLTFLLPLVLGLALGELEWQYSEISRNNIISALDTKHGACDTSAPPPKCPSNSPPGLSIQLPHQYDCSKYYWCSWGEPYPYDCKHGQHFSPKQQKCVKPEMADCECANGPVTEPPKPTIIPPDTAPGTCDQSAPEPKCPSNSPPGLSIQLPHQYDCSKYYWCSWGEPYPYDCKHGQHFSPKQQKCVKPEMADCECANGPVTEPPKPTVIPPDTVPGTCDPSAPPPTCPSNSPLGLPHQYDCSKYYWCDKGKLYPYDCKKGKHFSQKLQKCVYPEEADCECADGPVTEPPKPTVIPPDTVPGTCDPSAPPPTCPSNSPLGLPHQYDCSKYYWCDKGKLYPYDCKKGKHFSQKLQKCVYPEEADCECADGPVTEPPKPTVIPPDTVPGTCDPSAPPPTCPSNSPLGLPHQYDCSKYYWCDKGKLYPYDCKKGKHFSQKLQKCVYPEEADCECADGPVTEPPKPTVIPPDTVPGTCDPSAPPPTCPSNSPLGLPHQYDCSKYYWCDKGKLYPYDCKKGKHFSQKQQKCVYPEEADCECADGPVTEPPKPTVIPPDTVPGTCDPSAPPPTCPSNSPLGLPHQYDCSKYYWCDKGKLYPYDCKKGKHFSQKQQKCVYPEEADCECADGPVTEPPKPTVIPPDTVPGTCDPSAPPPTCPSNSPLGLPHQYDCSKYYWCDKGKLYPYDCKKGKHFSQKQQKCVYPEEADCECADGPVTEPPKPTVIPPDTVPGTCDPSAPQPTCPSNSPLGLPHQYDCSKYYWCDKGKLYPYDCKKGKHFSQKQQKCVYPEEADCECADGPVTEPPKPTVIPPDTVPGTCDPSAPPPTCPSNSPLGLPHQYDCSKYYWCDKGKLYPYDCKKGKHFSQKQQKCVYPEEADCECADGPVTEPPKPTVIPPDTVPGTCDPSAPPPTCPSNSPLGLPHQYDCSKYYWCDKGKLYPYDCKKGKHFSQKLQKCVYPEEADCECADGPVTEPPKPTVIPPDTVPGTCDPSAPPPTCPSNSPLGLPHQYDCTKYYWCDKGKRYPYDCKKGKHFSQKQQKCVYPEEADCECADGPVTEPPKPTVIPPDTVPGTCDPSAPPPTCPSNSPLGLPHQYDCTKYYWCDKGKRYPYDCKKGKHFSQKQQKCVYPEEADCECADGPVTEPPKPTVIPPDTVPGTCDPSAPPPTCPSNSPLGLPHQYDCSKYYWCDKGKLYPYDCKKGKHFSQKQQKCVYPEEADCECADGPVTEPPKPTVIPPDTVPGTCDPSAPPPTCPSNSPLGLPHQYDCTKYYWCDKGKRYPYDCKKGKHFSQKQQKCVYPEEADCECADGPVTEPPKPTDIPPDTVPGTCDPSAPPPTCPSNSPLGLPHQYDCTKYYWCDKGKRYPYDCKKGKHFSQKQQKCVYPEEADCECADGPVTEPPKPTDIPPDTVPGTCDPSAPPPTCPSNSPLGLPHQYDCSKYYWCDKGKLYPYDCKKGKHFSQKQQKCVYPEEADCECADGPVTEPPKPTVIPPDTVPGTCDPSAPPPTCPSNSPLGLPHQYDCTKYYWCDKGKLYPYDCKKGKHFSQKQQKCVYPEEADCECADGPVTEPPKPTVIPPDTVPGTCDPSAPQPTCPSNSPLGLPHQYDCSKYYWCDKGKLYPYDCKKGKHFSQKQQKCVYPEEADCECANGPVTEPPSTQEPEVPSTTQVPEVPPTTQVPEVPSSTSAPEEPSTTQQPEVTPSTQEPEVPPTTQVPEVPPTTQVPEVPSSTSAPEEPSTTQQPEVTLSTQEPEVPPTTQVPEIPSSTQEPEVPLTCDPSLPKPTCPEHDPTGLAVHLPHQYDCTKFYKCDWGVPYLRDCPAGLHFDPVLEVCNWPAVAGCKCADTQQPEVPPTTQAPEVPSSTQEPEVPLTCDPSLPKPTCPEHDPTGLAVHLPHQYDCNKFYKCDWGIPYLHDCPAGLHFDPVLEVCNWPAVAGCKCADTQQPEVPPSTQEPEVPPTTHVPEVPPSTQVPEVPLTCDPSSPIPTCPTHDPTSLAVFLPHQYDCTKFYICNCGVQYLRECSSGLHFDPVLENCNWPAVAGCRCADTQPPEVPPSTQEPEVPPTTHVPEVPPSTQVPEVPLTCDPSSPIPTCPTHDPTGLTVHLPHQYDCTKFYKCSWGVPILHVCAAGLHFDPVLENCNRPAVAGCSCKA